MTPALRLFLQAIQTSKVTCCYWDHQCKLQHAAVESASQLHCFRQGVALHELQIALFK